MLTKRVAQAVGLRGVIPNLVKLRGRYRASCCECQVASRPWLRLGDARRPSGAMCYCMLLYSIYAGRMLLLMQDVIYQSEVVYSHSRLLPYYCRIHTIPAIALPHYAPLAFLT
jgi:hypothetical protein